MSVRRISKSKKNTKKKKLCKKERIRNIKIKRVNFITRFLLTIVKVTGFANLESFRGGKKKKEKRKKKRYHPI